MELSKALRKIGAALSLGRVVVINVVALVVAFVAAVHVYNRETNPRPAPIVRGILAAHPTPAPAASATEWLPGEIEILDDAPAGSTRAPASPGVNDAIRR